MKKTLGALAVLVVAAGTASAQSTVTLFGVVDTGISYFNAESRFYSRNPFALPPVGTPTSVTQSKWAESTGNHTGSRWGVRGTEDLGGGLGAAFWLESGIASDTGAGTAPGGIMNFNRRSTVSLLSWLGEVRLGRDFTPTYINDLVDPFSNGGVGATLIATIGTNLATARGPGSAQSPSDNYVRTSNSIAYFTPQGLGGFYGQLTYALPETVKVSGLPQSSTGRFYGGRFGYAKGPIDVALAYSSSQAVDNLVRNVLVDESLTTASLIATYDFGPFKLIGQIAQMQDKRDSLFTSGVSTQTEDKYNGGMVGVTVPIGVGLIRATYAKVNFNGFTNNDASTQKLAIGYVHNLSKRTNLYATAAKVEVKDGQNNPAIMGALAGSSGLTYLSTGAGVQGYAPHSSTGYEFGIRHAF
ncbi:porin [Variovorax saccharolyticus]|uniref:porin n=1 Tax=Variovorax saccharolyticus TaxID=3053516 RepID=UPI002574E99A|nr:porin [Variovorax sp. J22R187]MDM0022244.1 porin [Variovorax sp. J22R187]